MLHSIFWPLPSSKGKQRNRGEVSKELPRQKVQSTLHTWGSFLSWACWVWQKEKEETNSNLQVHKRVTKRVEPTILAVENYTGKGVSHKLQLEMFRLNFSKISLSSEQCRETADSPSSVFSKTWRDRSTGNLLNIIVLLQEGQHTSRGQFQPTLEWSVIPRVNCIYFISEERRSPMCDELESKLTLLRESSEVFFIAYVPAKSRRD